MTPEEQKDFDAMKGAANTFHTSSVLLQDVTMMLAKVLGKQGYDIRSNLISSYVLYALSAEIALKAILKYEDNPNARLHDLKSLFESINQWTRDEIRNEMVKKYKDFENLLEENKKGFIDWRYFYEGTATPAAISFLRDFSANLCKCAMSLKN